MFYREAGQFKTTYQGDQAVFPILQDKIAVLLAVAVAFHTDFMAPAVATLE